MEGMVALAGLVLLFVLIVVPVVAFRANGRSQELEHELKKMRADVAALRERLESLPDSVWQNDSLTTEVPIGAQNTPADAPVADTASSIVGPVTSPVKIIEPVPDVWAAGYQAHVARSESEVEAEAYTAKPASESVADAYAVNSAPDAVSEEFTPNRSENPSEKQIAARSVTSDETHVVTRPDTATQPSAANERGLLSTLFDWFMRDNPLAKVGILLLFFGLAYLMKYSIERDLFPIELRLGGACVIAMGLLGLGWRLRHKQPLYALILQGGATGALYIIVLGACQLWALVPFGLAFSLLLVICAASVALAILQRSLSLAMLASTGGYLAPVLLSTGSGNYIALFSYYLLLSLGILAITVRQPWRPLNLLGFVFSFGVAGLWGMRGYRPEYWLFCQLFLLASLFIFGIFSNLLSLRSRIPGEKLVDSVMMLGPPLVGFGMQYTITAHWKYGAAFSALGFGLIYLALAGFAVRRLATIGKPFVMSALALGACFTTLAIPLALSAKWTAFAWAIEGLGILWTGLYQKQRYVSYSGTGLLLLALGSAIHAVPGLDRFSFCLVFGIISLSWLAAAWLWRNRHTGLETGLLAGGVLLWITTLARGVELHSITDSFSISLLLALITLSVLAGFAVAKRLKWSHAGYSVWLLWPAMLLALGAHFTVKASLSDTGWISLVWPGVLATAFFLLRYAQPEPQGRVAQGLMAGAIVVWVGVLIKLVQPESVADVSRILLLLGLMVLSALLWLWLAARLRWPLMGYCAWLHWPAMLLAFVCQIAVSGSLFNAGWINLVWLPALALALYLLRRGEPRPQMKVEAGLHLALMWMLLLALGMEFYRLLETLPWGMTEWKLALTAGVGVAVVLAVLYAQRRGLWPFAHMPQVYAGVGLAPVLLVLSLYAVAGNLCDGVMIGWPYIPLLNPLEVGAGLALCTLVLWANRAIPYLAAILPPQITAHWRLAGVVLAGWWLNGIILRTLSYYGAVDWQLHAMWASRLVQTSMSLLWALAALAIMVGASRYGRRNSWFVGAAIMGIIVVKLFLVDSAHGGGLMRAIAFIGVAILMLIIGYFSALPPKAERKDAVENKG